MKPLKESTKKTYMSGIKRTIEDLKENGPIFKTRAENTMQNKYRCSVELLHKMHTDGIITLVEGTKYHYLKPYDKVEAEKLANDYHLVRETRNLRQ